MGKKMVPIIPEMLEMQVDGIGKTGLIIGRNTILNNNKDQIIFKTMKELHHLNKKILKKMVPIIPGMPVDGIGKTGLIIGRNTMQNNNNKDQIIFKTMKEVKYSMKMMSLFCCNELEKKSQKILLRQLVLLLLCFPF